MVTKLVEHAYDGICSSFNTKQDLFSYLDRVIPDITKVNRIIIDADTNRVTVVLAEDCKGG